MAVTGINHINVRTSDIKSSAAFFEEVLGLEFRETPLPQGRTGCWLYDSNNNPIIHLRLKEADGEATGAPGSCGTRLCQQDNRGECA